MFRNDKKAFAQDQKTRLIVNDAVYSGYLEAMNVNQRFFMLLPLIHSEEISDCLLYTSPSPRDGLLSRMPSSA